MLIYKPCFYCDKSGVNFNSRVGVPYNGLDRVDNDIGYIFSNVVTCCIKCNTAKLDYAQKDFIEWISVTYNNLFNKNIVK